MISAAPDGHGLWAATAAAAPDCPPLARDIAADVAIVGGGFAGLSAALHLAERGRNAVVLEAGEPGFGGSGRNGGQVIPGLAKGYGPLRARFGEATAQRLFRFGQGTANYTFALIARHEIACDARQSGYIQCADSAAGVATLGEKQATAREFGVALEWLDRAALARSLGTEAYIAGLRDPRGGTVQPLSLARGLARAAMTCGAAVHARSRVERLERTPDGRWRAICAGGSVTAPRALIATAALTGSLWPGLARTVLTVWSFQIATEPLPPALAACVLPAGEAVSDLRRVLRYWRKDLDGRIVVGGKGRLRAPRDAAGFALQERILARLYPEAAALPIAFRWGGRIAVQPSRVHAVHALAPGLLATLCDNGKGVAWNVAHGAALAGVLAGGAPEDLPLPPTAPAAIPFHVAQRAFVAAGSLWLRALDLLDVQERAG